MGFVMLMPRQLPPNGERYRCSAANAQYRAALDEPWLVLRHKQTWSNPDRERVQLHSIRNNSPEEHNFHI